MSDLNFVDIKENNKNIKSLYKSAFPANERMPFWLLKRLAKKENADFYGIVLDSIKQKYDNHRIVLNIEEIDLNSNNNEQRLKRKKFYEKSGFKDLNYKVKEAGVVYETLCYSSNNIMVSKEEYMEMMKKYFGKLISKYVYRK